MELYDESSTINMLIPKDSSHSVIRMLTSLAKFQNLFLKHASETALIYECKNTAFLNLEGKTTYPMVDLLNVKEGSIVGYPWKDSILDYSQTLPELGKGHRIVYDFDHIERLLAVKTLPGTVWINTESSIRKTRMKDDILSDVTNMLKRIEDKIPQKQMDDQTKDKIDNIHAQGKSAVRALYSFCQTMLSFAVHANPNENIAKVGKNWKVSMQGIGDEMIFVLEKSLRVCHFTELYEYAEIEMGKICLGALVEKKSLSRHEKDEISTSYSNEESGRSLFSALSKLASRYPNDTTDENSASKKLREIRVFGLRVRRKQNSFPVFRSPSQWQLLKR